MVPFAVTVLSCMLFYQAMNVAFSGNLFQCQNRQHFQLVPIEKLMALMSLLPHQEPLGPTLSLPGRGCQIQASSLKYLYHAWIHRFLRCVSCSSIVNLNKSHLLQWFLKIHGVYLSGKPCEHRLRIAIFAFVQFLFSG